jgi:hypothetical protein
MNWKGGEHVQSDSLFSVSTTLKIMEVIEVHNLLGECFKNIIWKSLGLWRGEEKKLFENEIAMKLNIDYLECGTKSFYAIFCNWRWM